MAGAAGAPPPGHAACRSLLADHRAGKRRPRDPCPSASSAAMKTKAFNTTVLFYPNRNPKLRLFALWYFTTLVIVWTLVGHTALGFEQSWATPVTAIAAAIAASMLLDWVDARARGRE